MGYGMAQAGPVTVVAVDTTEFYSDPKLFKSAWTQMRLAALKGTASLWIPEVVVRETVRHYDQQVSQHFAAMGDADEAIAGLAWSEDEPWAIDEHYDEAVGKLVAGYEKWLRARLTRVGATILPLPSMRHEEIVSRMLREEKPFRIKGGKEKKGADGYRDILIWASIAEHAAKTLGPDDTLIFVTRNHSDFCDAKDLTTVAAVLLADLTGADQSAKQLASFTRALPEKIPSIRRVDALTNLTDILPDSAADDAELEMQDALATETSTRSKLWSAVTKAATDLVGKTIADADQVEKYSDGLDFDAFHLPLEFPRLRELDVKWRSAKATVYGTDPDSEQTLILAQVTAKADAYLEGKIHVSDYDQASGFTVSLVNRHMYEAEGMRTVLLHFNARIEPDGTVASLDLEKAVPAASAQEDGAAEPVA